MNHLQANGKATTKKTMFSRETAVSIQIQADQSVIWQLLTNAADFPRWNSTVVSIEGNIKQGETINLKSTLDEKRVFKLTIKEVNPENRLVWGDRQGNRVYTLTPGDGGVITFSMIEKIGGLMFPLYGSFIPPFDEAFEQFAADLKKEAETIQNASN